MSKLEEPREASGGHRVSSRAPRAAAPGTIHALQAALAAEHAAVYGYGVVGAYLTGSSRAAATADWGAHQGARDGLEAVLPASGPQPGPAAAAHRLPTPR